MKQDKPSMQIISVNQNPVAYSEDLVAGKTLSYKAQLSVAWGCQLVTELAAHIMKHGDTWNNADPEGVPNPWTIHAGRPVEAGVKYVITKWYRTQRWF